MHEIRTEYIETSNYSLWRDWGGWGDECWKM